MQLYIYKNNEQTGPFDEDYVLGQLRSGAFSPGDLGIRQGESAWKPLGEIFAGRFADAPAFQGIPSPSAANVQNVASAPAPKAAGGCRVAAGWLMLVFGLLMFVAGLGIAVGTPYVFYTGLCDIADRDKAEVDKLAAEYKAAKGTSEELEKQIELERALDSFESANEYCGEALATRRMYQVGAGFVAALGFFIAIIGFFLRRVRGG